MVQGFPGAGGGRQFLALDAPGLVVLASGRDPCCYEYAGAMRQATNEWASGEKQGRVGCMKAHMLPAPPPPKLPRSLALLPLPVQ